MGAVLGYCFTIGGILLGIIWKCVTLSRNTQSQQRAAAAPTSIEGILVQIGKLADAYIISRPLWKIRQDTTRKERTTDDDDRKVIVNLHKYLNHDESVLIRHGFIITIDISHKLYPLLRFMGNPISQLIVIPLSLVLIITGLMILYGSNIIGVQLLLICLIIVTYPFMMIVNSLRQRDSLLSLLFMYHFKRQRIYLEIDSMSVCVDDLFRPHDRIRFQNTPSLKFVEINRGELTGIGLDNGRSCTDIFPVHRQMEVADLSHDKLQVLIEQLNKCLTDAQDAKL